MSKSFSEARQEITGDSWLDDLARQSLTAAEAKFQPAEMVIRRDWAVPLPDCEQVAQGLARFSRILLWLDRGKPRPLCINGREYRRRQRARTRRKR